MSLRLHYAVRSHVGHIREGNEDSAYAGPRLLAVADGMGGHAAGEVASSTVISQLAQLDEDIATDSLEDVLVQSLRSANAKLRSMSSTDGALEGMGTTITAMLSSGDYFGVLHVGDSRAYRLRDGNLVQITHDHTLVQDLVDQGRITPEQANTHPQRSLLMRALDGREVEPDLWTQEAVAGDRYLLCTDGLSGVVSEETILDTLLLPTPQEAVDRLVELALKGGGPDNITCVVADVVDTEPPPSERPLVAGAAAEKKIIPGAAPAGILTDDDEENDSAAARAAKIGKVGFRRDRPAVGEQPDSDAMAGRRRRILVVSAVVALFVVGGAVAGWAWVNSQYYVGVSDDRVAVFNGVDADFPGLTLSEPVATFALVAGLDEDAQARLGTGIAAGSRTEAERIAASLTPEPTPSPASTPSTDPSKSDSDTPSTASPEPTATNVVPDSSGLPTNPVGALSTTDE